MKKIIFSIFITIVWIQTNAQQSSILYDTLNFKKFDTPPTFNYRGHTQSEKILNFIADNLQWPRDPDGQISCSGSVIVDLTINEIREQEQSEIKRKLCTNAFDNEALRVIKLMEKWEPAYLGGHAIKSNITIPVRFTLE